MFVIFSILGRSQKKQCSRHFSKKSIPGLFYQEPHRKVNATTLELRATNFKNLKQNRPKTLLFCEIWVSKNPGFVPGSPPGVLYFQKWPLQKKPGKLQKHKKCHCVMKCFFNVFFGPHVFFWAPWGPGPHWV